MNIWEVARDKYSSAQLWLKEDINNWSLGQVYMHVIHNIINYNFAQIKICISIKTKRKHPMEKTYLSKIYFPMPDLKTPPSASGPDQPESLKVAACKAQRN